MPDTLWKPHKFDHTELVSARELLNVLVIIIWIWILISIWSKYLERFNFEWLGFNPSKFGHYTFVVLFFTIVFFFYVHFTGSARILEEDV